MNAKFIVDANVGKLTKWLRLLGYDAIFFGGAQDGEMISTALREDRVILTRDTHILEWGVVKSGRVKALLINADHPDTQIRQVIRDLNLDVDGKRFTRCLECGESLRMVAKGDVKSRVPPYVFETQEQFLECPRCRRLYWRGTHWQAMVSRLRGLKESHES